MYPFTLSYQKTVMQVKTMRGSADACLPEASKDNAGLSCFSWQCIVCCSFLAQGTELAAAGCPPSLSAAFVHMCWTELMTSQPNGWTSTSSASAASSSPGKILPGLKTGGFAQASGWRSLGGKKRKGFSGRTCATCAT